MLLVAGDLIVSKCMSETYITMSWVDWWHMGTTLRKVSLQMFTKSLRHLVKW